MKILHVSLWPIDKTSIGGTERYVVELSSGLQRRGYESSVLMLSGKAWSANGVNYVPLTFEGIDKFDEYSLKDHFFNKFDEHSLLEFGNTINKVFDYSSYDIIHFNSLLFLFCAPEKKRVFTIHTNPIEFDQNWGIGSFDKICRLIKNGVSSDTLFIAPAKFYAVDYEKRLGRKIETIPHAIPEKFWSNSAKILKVASTFNILVPARLEIEQKGQDLLMQSLRLIKDKLPIATRVIFSGLDGQYKHNVKLLRKLADGFNYPVVFQNFSPDEMFDEFLRADLVILPSRYESYGYSALESLAMGKKTVLSNIPTYKEIASGNNLAFIAEKTPEDLGRTILEAISSGDKPVSKKWGKRYLPEEWLSATIKCYQKCLKNI